MRWPSSGGALGCALRFGVAYVLLVLAWPSLAERYSLAYQRVMGQLASAVGVADRVEVLPAEHPTSVYDLEIRVRADPPGRGWAEPHSSRYPAYMSLAFFAALLVATPVPPGRWLRMAALGFGVLGVALGLRLATGLLVAADADPLPWLPPPVLGGLIGVLGMPWYAMPTLIWAGVAYRPVIEAYRSQGSDAR